MGKRSIFILLTSLLLIPSLTQASIIDQDNDGLIDRFEKMIGTNFQDPDSDDDGYSDKLEVFTGHHPLNPDYTELEIPLWQRDTDGDGLSDYVEANINSDYQNIDSDNDGHTDYIEIQYGFSPLDPGPTHYGKRIKVNLESQTLSYYVGDHHINSILVSTGLYRTPTPAGEYSVLRKIPNHLYVGEDYYYPNTKWNLMFKYGSWGNYYVHGAYWHNKFGNRMSHGCVNVSYRDMEHLYNWADLQTEINIR